jgi:16S rRNA (cytidine1402-2'-O)-methyltransferase
MLYIVSTPIGNLEDITMRAIRTLKEVDLIAAEDTRQTQKLLNRYEIKTPTISYHSHSGTSKITKIVQLLSEGQKVALVSDAGTPGISDPAYTLIQAAIKENIQISPIPGPSAVLSALVMSGKPMNQFNYLGFLPLKKGRQSTLTALAEDAKDKYRSKTTVIYESPHRILKTLSDLQTYFGPDHQIAICREITKIYEEALRFTVAEAIEHFSKTKPKGEFVILF